MRILHLIEPGSPGGGACTLRMLAEPLRRLRSVEHDVIVLGTRAHADLARRCGVRVTGVVAAPLGVPAIARNPLARAIDIYESATGTYDVIHAWTMPALVAAALAAPRRPRLATLAVGPVSGVVSQITTSLLRRYPSPLLATSSAVAREYRSMGVEPALISVLPPAVNRASVPPVDRAEVRARWGVGDDTIVVGLLSEPTSWADARVAASVIARVRAAGRELRVVAHHGATRRAEAERWLRRVGADDALIVDDAVAEPWRMVDALDAALLIGGELNSMDLSDAGSPFAIFTGGGRRLRPMPGIMPLLWAMSAGVPIIAEASDAARDIIDDGVSGLLVDQNDMNAVCDRLIRIHDDPTIAHRIGANAQRAVHERFHVSAYCVRLKEAYQRLVDGRIVRVMHDDDPVVEVPSPDPRRPHQPLSHGDAALAEMVASGG